jgi:hypothetical protein
VRVDPSLVISKDSDIIALRVVDDEQFMAWAAADPGVRP